MRNTPKIYSIAWIILLDHQGKLYRCFRCNNWFASNLAKLAVGWKVVEVLLGRTFKLYYTMLQQLLEHSFLFPVVDFLDVLKIWFHFNVNSTTFALKIKFAHLCFHICESTWELGNHWARKMYFYTKWGITKSQDPQESAKDETLLASRLLRALQSFSHFLPQWPSHQV